MESIMKVMELSQWFWAGVSGAGLVGCLGSIFDSGI